MTTIEDLSPAQRAQLLYSPRRVAEMLDCSVRNVHLLIQQGHLPAVLPPGRRRGRRVRHVDLQRYIENLPPAEHPTE